MQLKNGAIELQTRKIRLPRGQEFTVTALSYGWVMEFLTLWPEPVIPQRVTHGAGGKRNVEYKTDDPKYQLEKQQREFALGCYKVWLVLRRDENIVWDTKEISSKDDLIALSEELRRSPLTSEELLLIKEASDAIAGDHVDEEGNEKDIRELFV